MTVAASAAIVGDVNDGHVWCGSDEWRAIVRDVIVPWVVGDRDLGDDVLEVGPGYGATTDVLRERAHRLTTVEIDPGLAKALAERLEGTDVVVVEGDATAMGFSAGRFSAVTCFHMLHHVPSTGLQDRIFAEAARVLRPGGVFIATDGVHSPETASFHDGDTYLPVDPATLPDRLARSGFVDIETEVDPTRFGWRARARVPSS